MLAEGLNIPTGLEWGDGGVYVGQNTELLFLKDTDGDGKADVRRVVLGGFGNGDTDWEEPVLHSRHRNFRPLDVKVGPDGAMGNEVVKQQGRYDKKIRVVRSANTATAMIDYLHLGSCVYQGLTESFADER